MSAAVKGLPAAEVVSWRRVFSATRRSWAAGYVHDADHPGVVLSAADLDA
jgi:hypothetical protein